MELSGGAIQCNCSICAKRGWLLAFTPAGSFRLTTGEDMLTDYQFNKKIIHHLFCKACGTASFARGVAPDGSESVAINVRCLDDVDLATVTVMPYDGKHV
jgi:hypothetical protein